MYIKFQDKCNKMLYIGSNRKGKYRFGHSC